MSDASTGPPFPCPTCPVCGAPPLMGMVLGGGTQAFCSGGDGCPVLNWDPSLDAAMNLNHATFVSLTEAPPPDDQEKP